MRALIVIMSIWLAWASSATAQMPGVGKWVEGQNSKWRWISAVNGVGNAERIQLGLEAKLDDGWKIYWRSPGDAGLPPQITVLDDSSLSDLKFDWPVPLRFQTDGVDTIGYEKSVIFPVTAKSDLPGFEQRLNTEIFYLICADICIPGSATLSIDMPKGPASPSFEAVLIDEALALVPDDGTRHNMALSAADLRMIGGQPELNLQIAAKEPFSPALDAFVEAGDDWRFTKPQVTFSADGLQASLTMQGSTIFDDVSVPGLDQLAITFADGAKGFEVTGTDLVLAAQGQFTLTKPVAASANSGGLALLAFMLGTALLGGLILNLMPCVLPVLSLKVLSVVKAQDQSLSQARIGFIATAAGILFSFWILAVGILALKAGGAAVGWGLQFQQPLFLAFMIALLMAFALNLFGLFEIQLPAAFSGLGGVGTQGYVGHFLTGAFATLLATPCSAPFLGTALGFALTRGTVEILAIFTALGIGMALPYLLIAIAPQAARILPKPGSWMGWVKVIMGLALVATAIWLISVLTAQIGQWASLVVVGLILIAAGALASQKLPTSLAATPLALVLALPLFFSASSTASLAFDTAAIDKAVARGETVFVDVTAQWCVTCLVNKRTVLDTAKTQELFGQNSVVFSQADWTKPNESISNYLASFDRFGIPFNIVYGPKAPAGIPLPEILTYEAVKLAVDQASI